MADDAELAKLLEEQAAFLKSGKPAAAKVTRGPPPRIGKEPLLPVLNPDAAPPPRPRQPPLKSMPTPMPSDPAAGPGPIYPPVMTEIVEREPDFSMPIRMPVQRRTGGFPRAMHRSALPAETRARLSGASASGGGSEGAKTSSCSSSAAATTVATCGGCLICSMLCAAVRCREARRYTHRQLAG